MLDWNPNDPDTVKVHYDVSAWSIDQRAELSEALAEEDLAHVWEDDELVVPEALESDVDLLFERLEAVLGPFPIPLDGEDPGVEFGLEVVDFCGEISDEIVHCRLLSSHRNADAANGNPARP